MNIVDNRKNRFIGGVSYSNPAVITERGQGGRKTKKKVEYVDIPLNATRKKGLLGKGYIDIPLNSKLGGNIFDDIWSGIKNTAEDVFHGVSNVVDKVAPVVEKASPIVDVASKIAPFVF